MKKVYSTAQKDYLNAKKAFEEVSKVLEKKIQTISVIREVQQAEMEKLVVETGFHDAFNNFTQAEDKLIEWSHGIIQDEKIYKENKIHFDNMYANLSTSPEARVAVVELAMKVK
jgi:hypothetical protein